MEPLDICRDIPAEYRRTGNDDIRARGDNVRRVVELCAAVNLELTVVAVLLDLRAHRTDLVHALRDKALAAKARLDRHDKHHVAVRQQREQHVRRGARLDRAGRLDARGLDLLQLLERIAVRLIMYGNDVRACLDEIIQILVRVRDHQMHVKHLIGRLAQRLDHRRADRDIGHKVAVHHVNMDVFRARIGGDLNIAFQIGKVRRKDGR